MKPLRLVNIQLVNSQYFKDQPNLYMFDNEKNGNSVESKNDVKCLDVLTPNSRTSLRILKAHSEFFRNVPWDTIYILRWRRQTRHRH